MNAIRSGGVMDDPLGVGRTPRQIRVRTSANQWAEMKIRR
jgi:hypothetical protein